MLWRAGGAILAAVSADQANVVSSADIIGPSAKPSTSRTHCHARNQTSLERIRPLWGIRAITAVEGTGCWRVFPHLNQFGIDIGNLEYKLASLSDSNDDCRIKNYYISVICKSILIPLALTVPLLYIPIGTLLTLPRSSPLASSSSSSHARCSSNTSHYSLLLPTFSPLYQIGYAAVAPIPMISSRAVEM